MENKKVELTTLQALELCQNQLGGIPYTVKQQETIGRPLAEVIGILEQIKQALIRNSEAKNATPEVTDNAGPAAE